MYASRHRCRVRRVFVPYDTARSPGCGRRHPRSCKTPTHRGQDTLSAPAATRPITSRLLVTIDGREGGENRSRGQQWTPTRTFHTLAKSLSLSGSVCCSNSLVTICTRRQESCSRGVRVCERIQDDRRLVAGNIHHHEGSISNAERQHGAITCRERIGRFAALFSTPSERPIRPCPAVSATHREESASSRVADGGMHQQMMVHHVELVQQQLVVRRQALHVQLRLVRQERIAPGLPSGTGSFTFGQGVCSVRRGSASRASLAHTVPLSLCRADS